MSDQELAYLKPLCPTQAAADAYFLEGSNQLICHGWPYSPESAGEPGWRFYAAAVLNQHNPWWLVMPD